MENFIAELAQNVENEKIIELLKRYETNFSCAKW